MKHIEPVHFKEETTLLRGGTTGASDMPVYRDTEQIISCWHVPLMRRFQILWSGRIWLSVRGLKHPPVWISTRVWEKGTRYKGSFDE